MTEAGELFPLPPAAVCALWDRLEHRTVTQTALTASCCLLLTYVYVYTHNAMYLSI